MYSVLAVMVSFPTDLTVYAADATELSGWAEQNNTVFNASKSVSMVISRSKRCTFGELSLFGAVIADQPCSRSPNILAL